MNAPSATFLLVDDDERFRTRLARALGERGHRVHAAGSHAEALELAARVELERAVVDLRMPGPNGLQVIRDLMALRPALELVVLTGYGSIATAMDAVRLGASNYIAKPADVDGILTAFARGDAPTSVQPESHYTAPSLARAEWEHINRVLSDCEGNVSEAARRLKIHRRSLQRKLQKYPPHE